MDATCGYTLSLWVNLTSCIWPAYLLARTFLLSFLSLCLCPGSGPQWSSVDVCNWIPHLKALPALISCRLCQTHLSKTAPILLLFCLKTYVSSCPSFCDPHCLSPTCMSEVQPLWGHRPPSSALQPCMLPGPSRYESPGSQLNWSTKEGAPTWEIVGAHLCSSSHIANLPPRTASFLRGNYAGAHCAAE